MKRFIKSAAFLTIVSITAIVPVSAQQAAPMPGTKSPTGRAATAAEGSMMSAMDKMSKAMAAVPMTEDADRDFVGMMIPHHQGAIEMAKFELAHGKDPAMLKLARDVVAAQDKEIVEMKAWQASHPAAR